MNRKAVLTAVGKDQTGIVAAVTGVLFELGYNLEASSMTLLQGEFAMIMILSVPGNDSLKIMKSKLQDLEKEMGLMFQVKELSEEESLAVVPENANPYTLNVVGVDHPGIVHNITKLLAARGINITNVDTQIICKEEQAPVYVMLLDLDVPVSIKEEDLHNELDVLSKELKVDITLEAVCVFKG